MIIHKCTSLQDARLPQLEEDEEEVYFRHPIHPLKVNQLGAMYFDEGYNEMEHSQSGGYLYTPGINGQKISYIGAKPKIVWECYTGESDVKHKFWFADGNQLNLTKANLIPKFPGDKNKELQEIEDVFIIKTMQWMEKCEKWCDRKGIDYDVFWSCLGFSFHLKSNIRAWKNKFKRIQKKLEKLNSKKKGLSPESIAKIIATKSAKKYAIFDGEEYTLTELVAKFNISKMHLSKVKKGRIKNKLGLVFL